MALDPPFRLAPVAADHPAMAPLREEAAASGAAFIARLVEEWCAGVNRFARPGEALLGAWAEDTLLAVGGIGRDHYLDDPTIGRLRHVFVCAAARRRGIARALVTRLLAEGRGTFRLVRLRSASAAASALYVELGFVPVDDPQATHVRVQD